MKNFEEEICNLKEENESLKKEIDILKKQAFSSRGEQQKKGMMKKASSGSVMSRIPFGYRMENKALVPAENFMKVEEIFQEFLNQKISLRKLSKKHNLSVNGLKKILNNFTYIGKVKFNGQIYAGNHKPLISSTLFNHVQDKLEKHKLNSVSKNTP